MSNFDLYRKKIQNSSCCVTNYESNFIASGPSSTTINHTRLNSDKQAAIMINEKEGPDNVIIFTYKNETDPNQELLKSDYFTWRNNTYFVFEDINLVYKANYKKQRAYQCNVDFVINRTTYYGYYFGSLAKYVDVTLEKDLIISNNDKPILICPYFDWIEYDKTFKIVNKPWKIIDFDMITNDKICYMSLDLDFNKEEDSLEDIVIGKDELKAGIEITKNINYGFFKTDKNVNIIKKTSNQIIFSIPYGIDRLYITTKDINKIDIVEDFKVV